MSGLGNRPHIPNHSKGINPISQGTQNPNLSPIGTGSDLVIAVYVDRNDVLFRSARFPQIEAQRKRVRFGSKEQRRERTMSFLQTKKLVASDTKLATSCLALAKKTHPSKALIPSSRKPAKRLRLEKEKQRNGIYPF